MNFVIALWLERKNDMHIGNNDVNVSVPLSFTPFSYECVSYNVATSLFNSPISKHVEEFKEVKSPVIIDSTPPKATSST